MGFFDFLKKIFGGKNPPKRREEFFPKREEFFPKREELFPKGKRPPPPPPKEPPGGGGGGKVPRKRVVYHPPYMDGKRLIKGYWRIGSVYDHATLSDVRELLETVPAKKHYSIIVNGDTKDIYPRKEKRENVFLSYVIEARTAWYVLEHHPLHGTEDWVNDIIKANEGEEWTTIYSIDVVDN